MLFDIKPLPPVFETAIKSAMLNFFIYGFTPGSYTSYMFQHEWERAKCAAHPMLLIDRHGNGSSHDLFIDAFMDLPEFLIKDEFARWPGFVYHTDEMRKLIRDSYAPGRIAEWQTYDAIAGKQPRQTFKVWVDQADEVLKDMQGRQNGK